MTEEFLHYLWKNKLYSTDSLVTSDGEEVRIMSPGQHSFHAGPDFIGAKIYIGRTLWAGNVEIHNRASDWYRHKHHEDKAYDNVILHVVHENDEQIKRSNNTLIPSLELLFNPSLLERYTGLQVSPHKVACEPYLGKINRFFIDNWLDRLLAERLSLKATQIHIMFEKNKQDLHETFYQLLFRNFGFKINAGPMEHVSARIPYKLIGKHRNNKLQIESLLFGQAGFLEEVLSTEYSKALKKEWKFLRNKYKLTPTDKHLWKFLRLRPMNFPTIRLAQLADLLHNNPDLLSLIHTDFTEQQLKTIFSADVSPFWNTHYTFTKESKHTHKRLGFNSYQNIIINTVAPWLFFYGQLKSQQKYKDKAIEILESVPSEQNTIINYWKKHSVAPVNAAQSQSLLQLYNEYCKPRGCLFCHIGNLVLTNSTEKTY